MASFTQCLTLFVVLYIIHSMNTIPTTHIAQKEYEASPWDTAVTLRSGVKVFRHPLNCDLALGSKENEPLLPGMPTVDERKDQMLQRLKEAYDRKSFHRYVFFHARPFRFQAGLDAREWTPEDEWYTLMGEIWTDAEGPGINKDIWEMMVFNPTHGRKTMLEEEEAYLNALPDVITAYRGSHTMAGAVKGLSWTVDKEKAVWFAKRFQPKKSWLATIEIPKEEVLAAFTCRGESELIISTSRGRSHKVHTAVLP